MAVSERIARFLAINPLDLESIFGHGTQPEDLAIYLHELDTCHCAREFMISKVSPEDDRREFPISTPRTCARHMPHQDDMVSHHKRIVEENQHRQHVKHEILALVGTRHKNRHVNQETGEEGWSFKVEPRLVFDADGELNVHMPESIKNDALSMAAVQSHLDQKYTRRRVKLLKKG